MNFGLILAGRNIPPRIDSELGESAQEKSEDHGQHSVHERGVVVGQSENSHGVHRYLLDTLVRDVVQSELTNTKVWIGEVVDCVLQVFKGPVSVNVAAAPSIAPQSHAVGVISIGISRQRDATTLIHVVHWAEFGVRASGTQCHRGGVVDDPHHCAFLRSFRRDTFSALEVAEGVVGDPLAGWAVARVLGRRPTAVHGFTHPVRRPNHVVRGEWANLPHALGVRPVEVVPLVGSHRFARVPVDGSLRRHDLVERVLARIREEQIRVSERGGAEGEENDGGDGHHQVGGDGVEVVLTLEELLGPREDAPKVPARLFNPRAQAGPESFFLRVHRVRHDVTPG